MTRKKKKDGLESKVSKIDYKLIKKDQGGRYLPFCNFVHHSGIVQDENVCIKRRCENYYKLYISRKSRPYN